jgi:hypothetical protein
MGAARHLCPHSQGATTDSVGIGGIAAIGERYVHTHTPGTPFNPLTIEPAPAIGMPAKDIAAIVAAAINLMAIVVTSIHFVAMSLGIIVRVIAMAMIDMPAKDIAAIGVASINLMAIVVTSIHFVAMSLGVIVRVIAVAVIGMPGEGAPMSPASGT